MPPPPRARRRSRAAWSPPDVPRKVPRGSCQCWTAVAAREAVEVEVDHRRSEEGEHLADDQPADHGEAERMAQLRADARAEHQRQHAEERGGGCHQDRPEAQERRLVDRLARALTLMTLGVERE